MDKFDDCDHEGYFQSISPTRESTRHSKELITCWPPPSPPSQSTDSSLLLESDSNHCSSAASQTNNQTGTLHLEESSHQEKRRRLTFDEPVAGVALASWLRRDARELSLQLPKNLRVRSKLNFAATTPQGHKFLRDKLRKLEELEFDYSHSMEYYHTVATYTDLLRLTEKTKAYCLKCLALTGVNSDLVQSLGLQKYLNQLSTFSDTAKNCLWILNKLAYEDQLLKSTSSGEKSSEHLSNKSAKTPIEVARVNASELTVEDFKTEYCQKRRPVVIVGVESPTRTNWNLEHIRSVCADRVVSVKRTSSVDSTEWAGLEDAESKRVADFLDHKISDHYLFDWSLPLNAPALAAEFTVPAYFGRDNLLTRTACGALYRDSWPSLFVGPAGTSSGLHIDAFGSHFWMYLASGGRKRWTFYKADQAGDLRPRCLDSLDPIFSPNADELQRTECYTVDLKPGEFLFVPAGSPHRVDNLEDTIAVSGNFVDDSNVDEFTTHMRINALHDPRAQDLLEELINLKLIS